MKKILITALLAIFCFYTNAQIQILVDNNGTESVYDNITDALANAQSGANVYLPKGLFSLGNIDKEIHVYGIGYKEGTQVSSCYLIDGSDNSSFSGLEFTSSDVRLANNSDDTVRNVSFDRCKFNADMYTTYGGYSKNISFTECILNRVRGGSIKSEYNFYNKCMNLQNSEDIHSSFKNCIFFGYVSVYASIQNFYENNIFIYSSSPLTGTYHTFNQNLFVFDIKFPLGTHLGSNNIVNIPLENIFENYDGSGFSFDHDYHLKASCPGKNAGADGTDMGIYGTEVDGTPTPALEFGAIGNPQIYESEISNEVGADGKLQMTVRVKAQQY